jgi:hypothetical protein
MARALYESGRLHEVDKYLESCQSSSVKAERIEAYKLLCLTYIYLEEPEKADAAMLKLLQIDHEFVINPKADPAEFVALYRTFRTDPVYRLGGKLGTNITQPNVLSFIPANDGKSEYSAGIGFQGGVSLELPLSRYVKGLTFAPDLNFVFKNFNYSNDVTVLDSETGDDRDFKTTGKERHMWISVPISFQYDIFRSHFDQKRIKPFIGIGLSTDILINASNTFLRTKEGASSLEEQTLNVTGERNKINLSGIVTGGIKLRVAGGYAIAEVRYSHALTKANDIEDIYALAEKTFPSGYVDGVFKLNTISVCIGYTYNIYNPKKISK